MRVERNEAGRGTFAAQRKPTGAAATQGTMYMMRTNRNDAGRITLHGELVSAVDESFGVLRRQRSALLVFQRLLTRKHRRREEGPRTHTHTHTHTHQVSESVREEATREKRHRFLREGDTRFQTHTHTHTKKDTQELCKPRNGGVCESCRVETSFECQDRWLPRHRRHGENWVRSARAEAS
jgi:hypothetical protein